MDFRISVVLILLGLCSDVFSYHLNMSCDSPTVLGATINCTTSVIDDSDNLASGNFRYTWITDFLHVGKRVIETGPTDTWNITYDMSLNNAGTFVVRVEVCELIMLGIICSSVGSMGNILIVTDTLNGKIVTTQSKTERDTFVSVAEPLQNIISLKSADRDLISGAPTVLSYWFVDCIYYGITTDFRYDHNFTKPNEIHYIEALVMADFTPIPPPTTQAPSTTTTTTTTTTIKPTSLHLPNNTAPVNSTTPQRIKRDAAATPEPTGTRNNTSKIKMWQNGTLVPYNVSFPYICNNTNVATDDQKRYGYFHKSVKTKAPISGINISGTNWLRYGELLDLNVKCSGSDQMSHCVLFKPGIYNVTGNETCRNYEPLNVCDFPIKRFLMVEEKNTIVIIIKNDVSIKVSSVTVTVYKVKPQAQLSVIVVPVAFSLVAVVTIVFGVAYYLQNRSRIIVEVADFDFGQQYTDMEYKTFKERLRDSIVNAFTRDPSTSEAPNWPPGHKYGSMT
ncbi:uncharacterized protein LOC143203465 [Rhynchophorus ferrugineus]|uniref:uncharacterized protein LOC143203465 n=1 Tax=Rhynchophorus ferrugineus TaxID=354439 RepID=UPI003FCE7587